VSKAKHSQRIPGAFRRAPVASALAAALCLALASPARANPNDTKYSAMLDQASALKKRERIREALSLYRQAAGLEPNRWEAYYAIGDCSLLLDDDKGSIASLEQGIKLAPTEAQLHLGLSRAHWAAGDSKAALADLNRAIALKPHSADFLGERAELYRDMGDKKSAIKDFNAAIKLVAPPNPNYFAMLLMRAKVYESVGDYQSALSDLTLAAADKDFHIVRILNERANCYDKLGKHDLAEKDRAEASHKGELRDLE
jgi:tetratricopeptide (TPR) repeat protein